MSSLFDCKLRKYCDHTSRSFIYLPPWWTQVHLLSLVLDTYFIQNIPKIESQFNQLHRFGTKKILDARIGLRFPRNSIFCSRVYNYTKSIKNKQKERMNSELLVYNSVCHWKAWCRLKNDNIQSKSVSYTSLICKIRRLNEA